MDRQDFRADWSPKSEYHIDFDRGSVAHSKTADQRQRHRLFTDSYTSGPLKHLSYPQATDYFKKMKTAEFFLMLLRQQYPPLNAERPPRSAGALRRPRPPTCGRTSASSTAPSTRSASPSARTSRSASCARPSTARSSSTGSAVWSSSRSATDRRPTPTPARPRRTESRRTSGKSRLPLQKHDPLRRNQNPMLTV